MLICLEGSLIIHSYFSFEIFSNTYGFGNSLSKTYYLYITFLPSLQNFLSILLNCFIFNSHILLLFELLPFLADDSNQFSEFFLFDLSLFITIFLLLFGDLLGFFAWLVFILNRFRVCGHKNYNFYVGTNKKILRAIAGNIQRNVSRIDK